MPHIIPIRDLKNTGALSKLCQASNEPVFITKNGYGDMVIMSMKTYEDRMLMQEVYAKVAAAEEQIHDGKVKDGAASLAELREKYNV